MAMKMENNGGEHKGTRTHTDDQSRRDATSKDVWSMHFCETSTRRAKSKGNPVPPPPSLLSSRLALSHLPSQQRHRW